MKKSVYISGIASTILMMFGCMFKIMHWPGASVLLILSVFLFCFYFLPFALINSYKTQGENKFKALHVVSFIVFFICILGVLFKVMHWPGAGLLLFASLLLPFVAFLPVYIYQTKDIKKEGNINFSGIMFGLTFLAVFSVMLALGVSRQILERGAWSLSNKLSELSFLNGSTTAKENKVSTVANDLCAYISELQCELLSATENTICANNVMPNNFEAQDITGKDNKDASNYLFVSEDNQQKVQILKTKLQNFKNALLESGKLNSELNKLTTQLISVENGSDENGASWEQKTFGNYQLIFVLDILSQIQSNVRLLEHEYLATK